jgi:hypothetical protein
MRPETWCWVAAHTVSLHPRVCTGHIFTSFPGNGDLIAMIQWCILSKNAYVYVDESQYPQSYMAVLFWLFLVYMFFTIYFEFVWINVLTCTEIIPFHKIRHLFNITHARTYSHTHTHTHTHIHYIYILHIYECYRGVETIWTSAAWTV